MLTGKAFPPKDCHSPNGQLQGTEGDTGLGGGKAALGKERAIPGDATSV